MMLEPLKLQEEHYFKITSEFGKEVFRIEPDGTLFWELRKIETDEDFKKTMMALAKTLCENL